MADPSSPTLAAAAHALWPGCGAALLHRDAQGGLQPTAGYFQAWLRRPELALVAESCAAEVALHQALAADPLRPVSSTNLQALQDEDARTNYRLFVNLRDALLRAGTLQAWLLALWRNGNQGTPPLFINLVVQAVLQQLLSTAAAPEASEGAAADAGLAARAMAARAAEMLFREQRVSLQEGRWLAGDRETLDLQHETQGFGDIGRLLVQAQQPVKAMQLQVLSADNARAYWAEACSLHQPAAPCAAGTALARHRFVLDLRHHVRQELGHGLVFHLTQAQSGLQALAGVLQQWVQHLLGVQVKITPLEKIDDPQWGWHVGLDAESSALLNDLYQEKTVEPARLQRLISLFRLDFDNPHDMLARVAGKPVYLGLMATPDGLLRIKPQNLVLNLPLAKPN